MEIIPAIEGVLHPGTNVQIESIGSNRQKVIVEAMVANMNKTALYLIVSGGETVLQHLTQKKPVFLICKFNNEPRDLVFFSELIKISVNPYTLVVKRPASYILGRCFMRYDVNLPFNYFLEGKEYTDGQIVNLSFGGLSGIIQPNTLLVPEVEIVCQLTLPHNSASEFIVGRVIRVEEQETHCKISVQFEDLTTDIEAKIAKYFFSIAKKMIKNDGKTPGY